MSYYGYPYTNFHELNADWLLSTVKKDAESNAELKATTDAIQKKVETDLNNQNTKIDDLQRTTTARLNTQDAKIAENNASEVQLINKWGADLNKKLNDDTQQISENLTNLVDQWGQQIPVEVGKKINELNASGDITGIANNAISEMEFNRYYDFTRTIYTVGGWTYYGDGEGDKFSVTQNIVAEPLFKSGVTINGEINNVKTLSNASIVFAEDMTDLLIEIPYDDLNKYDPATNATNVMKIVKQAKTYTPTVNIYIMIPLLTGSRESATKKMEYTNTIPYPVMMGGLKKLIRCNNYGDNKMNIGNYMKDNPVTFIDLNMIERNHAPQVTVSYLKEIARMGAWFIASNTDTKKSNPILTNNLTWLGDIQTITNITTTLIDCYCSEDEISFTGEIRTSVSTLGYTSIFFILKNNLDKVFRNMYRTCWTTLGDIAGDYIPVGEIYNTTDKNFAFKEYETSDIESNLKAINFNIICPIR